jgi:hypothetical protein
VSTTSDTNPTSAKVKIIPYRRTNHLLVIARPVDITYIKGIVEKLDQQEDDSNRIKIKLKYMPVTDFLAVAYKALAKDTDQAHAWWVIGRCAERRGAAAEAQDAFLQAHLRSPHQCIVPLAPPTDGWQPIIDAAFDQIDDTTGALWREIGLEVLDFPDEALLLDAVPPLPPGLLVFGVPYEGDRFEGDAPDSPAGLRVYVGNLAHAASFADAADRLADALEEEAANWGIHDDEE